MLLVNCDSFPSRPRSIIGGFPLRLVQFSGGRSRGQVRCAINEQPWFWLLNPPHPRPASTQIPAAISPAPFGLFAGHLDPDSIHCGPVPTRPRVPGGEDSSDYDVARSELGQSWRSVHTFRRTPMPPSLSELEPSSAFDQEKGEDDVSGPN